MEVVKLIYVEEEPMNEETAILVFEYNRTFTTCQTCDDGTIVCGFDDPDNLFILPYAGSIETRFPIRLVNATDYEKYKAQVAYVQNKLNENLDAINKKIEQINIQKEGR